MNNVFSSRLKELRAEKGLTLKYVSSTVGVPLTTYSSYERGVSEPPFSVLIALCNLFDVTSDYLIGRCDY